MNTRHLFFAVLLLTVFIAACSSPSNQEEVIQVSKAETGSESIYVSQEQFETMKMSWGALETRSFSKELALQGAVRIPVEGMQEIAPFFGGYVSGLTLIEGEQVRRGQVLFYLESPEFIKLQQDYLEAASQLNYLKAEYERQKTLFEEQISAEKNYLKASAEYQSTQAKAQSLKQQLKMIHIDVENLKPESIRSKVPVLSPIHGFVEEVFVVPGAYLPASGKAMALLNKDHVHIELIVFEKDAMKLEVGQRVKVAFPDQPEKKLDAEIHVIGQTVNEQRQINVHADLLDPEEEKKVVPGMYLEAKLQLDPQEALALPESAIGELDGKNYILVLKNQKENGFDLKKIEVQLGEIQDGLIQVVPSENLPPESQILYKGIFNLL